MDALKFMVVCFFQAILILAIVTISLSCRKKNKPVLKTEEKGKDFPKKTPIPEGSTPVPIPIRETEKPKPPKEIEKSPTENLRKETREVKSEVEQNQFVPLILDVPSLDQNTWTYHSEGSHFQVTSNETASGGILSYTHLKMGGTFNFEEVMFGGRKYPVPKLDKVLLITTFSLNTDPSYPYYIYVVKENGVFHVLVNDYNSFVFGMGTDDLRRLMEIMAVKFGRMTRRILFNMTGLANFEFENCEIHVSRKVMNENFVKVTLKKDLGMIRADGFTAFGKEQKGIDPEFLFESITVYYPLDLSVPLMVEFPHGASKKYYRNDTFNTWSEIKIVDLEDQLDHIYHDIETSGRLIIYMTLFTAKDEIPLETVPTIDEREYELRLVDKVKSSPTSYLFVFEYPEKVEEAMKLPMFYAFILKGTRDVPTSSGLWNRLKLKESTREIKRMYTPLYIDVDRRNIYFLIRVLNQCDMFPDGGAMTRYLNDLQIKEKVKNSVAESRFQIVKDNEFRVDGQHLEFESLNLIARGVGIVPFVRILSYYKEKEVELRLIFVNQTLDEVVLKPMLDQLTLDNPRLKTKYLLIEEEAEDAINSPLTSEIAEEVLENSEKTISLICGNPVFCSESTKVLEKINMKRVYCV